MSVRVEEILPVNWRELFSPAHPRIGLGLDLGTTEKKKSNPTALVTTQQITHTYFARVVARWKTNDPDVTRAVLRYVLEQIPHGLRARRLCIDATNERFFATDLRREFAGLVPVELVISSESTRYGGEDMSMKQYLGNLLINTMEDGYVALPPERWLQKDLRQTVRVRGTFEADVDEDGSHADCTRALELSLHAIKSGGGPAKADAAGPGKFGVSKGSRPGIKNPYARKQENRRRLTA